MVSYYVTFVVTVYGAISCTRAVRAPSSTCSYNRLLLAVVEEPEDSGTTQNEDVKKTSAKMLPSILSKLCMCTIRIYSYPFFVNDHGKFSES